MNDNGFTPSAGFRRLAAGSAFASLFAFALTVTITPAAVNQVVVALCHRSDTQIGRLYQIAMLGFVACVLAGGRYSDKRGKLPMLFIGCLLMAVGAYVFAGAQTFPMAALAMFLMGSGGGCTEAISMALVADVFGGSRRTAMMNLAQVFFAMGAVAGPAGVSVLVAAGNEHWRWAYAGTAACCFFAAMLALAALLKREERTVPAHHLGSWKVILRDRLVLILSIGVLLYVGAESGLAGWVARYFNEDLHSTGPLAAATVALFWGGIGLGRLTAAWTSRHISDYALICYSLGAAAVCQALLLLFHTPAPALVMVPMLGFALAPVWPTTVSRAGSIYPMQSGAVLGIVVAAGAMGAAIFPPAIGQAADWIGLRNALWTCFALSAVNFVIFLVLYTRFRSQSKAP